MSQTTHSDSTEDERAVTWDPREIHILKQVQGNAMAPPEHIAERLTESVFAGKGHPNVTPEEVEEVLAEKRLPDRFVTTSDIPPVSKRACVREVLRSDEDLLARALDGQRGYGPDVNRTIRERWSERYEVDQPTISHVKAELKEELEAEDDEDEELDVEDDDDDENASPLASATNGVERVKAVITDRDLFDILADGLTEDYIEDLQEAVKSQYGIANQVTEDTVRRAVAEFREEGVLPSLAEDIEGAGPDASIAYVCELCGFTHEDRSRVRTHLTEKDDGLHAGRNSKDDSHLISATLGEATTVEPPENVDGDTHFEVVWAVYNNPTAPQSDIAELLGISRQTLHSRIDILGLDWENREEQVGALFDAWFDTEEEDVGTPEDADVMSASPDPALSEGESETVTRKVGNATFKGPFTGLDATSGRPTTHLSEVDFETPEETVTMEVTAEEAFELLTGQTGPAARRLYAKAIETFTDITFQEE